MGKLLDRIRRLEHEQARIIGTLVERGWWPVDPATGRSLGGGKGGGAADPGAGEGPSSAPPPATPARTEGTDRGLCGAEPKSRPDFRCVLRGGHADPFHQSAKGIRWVR